jgi:hypothetical protein
VREDVADALHVDADWSVSAHDVAVDVVVEGLRGLGLEDHLDFSLSLSWDDSVHRFNRQRIGVLQFTLY